MLRLLFLSTVFLQHAHAGTVTGALYDIFGYDYQRAKCTRVSAQACAIVAPYYCRVDDDEYRNLFSFKYLNNFRCDVANPLTAWINANNRCHLHKSRSECDNDKTALREGVTLCYWDEDEW